MTTLSDVIPPGFGERLKHERVRLGLTQTELAERAGVQRLAESQYEAGTRDPRVPYLAAIGAAGVNLNYVLFGKAGSITALGPVEQRQLEQQVFNLIEDYVQAHRGGQLSAEARYVLFEMIRGHLVRASQSGKSSDLNISDLLNVK